MEVFDITTGHLVLTQKLAVSEGTQVLDRPATSAMRWSRDGLLLVRQPAVRTLSDDWQGHAGTPTEQLLVLRFLS